MTWDTAASMHHQFFNGQGGAQMYGGRLWVKSICCIYGMENCYNGKLRILVNMLAN